jgi:hypothetical protein
MALLQKAYLGATPLFADKPWFYQNEILAASWNTGSVTPTASATPHTKGSWSQVIASTSNVTTLIRFFIAGVNVSTADSATLLDIGVGASGSETVIVPNLAIGGSAGSFYSIPVEIPSGSRIAARIQGVRASQTAAMSARDFFAFNAGDTASIGTTVDVLGTDTATSTGTAMSGSSGTWVEIEDSTTKDYIGFAIAPSASDTDTAAQGDATYEIGVGPAGSEVAFGYIHFAFGATENFSLAANRSPNLFGREVPTGSRLAIRHNIAANPGKYDACIIAVPKV